VFLPVAPVQNSPIFSFGNPKITAMYNDYEAGLALLFAVKQNKYPDMTSFILPLYDILSKIQNTPAMYTATAGFKNTTGDCSGNDLVGLWPYTTWYESNARDPNFQSPSCPYPLKEYMFCNLGHPTWPVHQVLAQQIVSLLG
jgi:hypothetical protein